MEYSIGHITRIFNGETPPTAKFMKALHQTIKKILTNDLNTFYKLMIGTEWMNAHWENASLSQVL